MWVSKPNCGMIFFSSFFTALFFLLVSTINIIIISSIYKKKKIEIHLYPTTHTYHLKVVGSNPSWGTIYFFYLIFFTALFFFIYINYYYYYFFNKKQAKSIKIQLLSTTRILGATVAEW